MTKIKRYKYPEETLYLLWQSFCDNHQLSHEYDLQGIFAGALNKFDGPDFQGAEFELNGKVYRGDVEIHHKYKDWYYHGHHLDSRYDRVVLHLVWELDTVSVQNSKKLAIPTLSLKKFLSIKNMIENPINNCHLPPDKIAEFNKGIQNIALCRLASKAKQFHSLIQSSTFDQVLYMMMLRLLGMPQNSNNFERVALLIPWEKIQLFRRKNHPLIECLIALYMIVSGLIDKKSYLYVLRKYEFLLKPDIIRQTMAGEVWKLAGQRPANSPLIHLIGLAHFIYQFKYESVYRFLKDLFSVRLLLNDLYHQLCLFLSPSSSDYWYHHCKDSFLKPNNFWGRSLQTEIIGNIFIPFFYQEALNTKSFGFAAYLEEFYLFLPSTNNYARLQQYNHWTELNSSVKKHFYCNQALLLLQNNYCLRKGCNCCPLERIPKHTHAKPLRRENYFL